MSSYVIRKTPGDTEWFRHDRFGMFIHWGSYAMAGRHEWVRNNEKIPEEKYNLYAKYFNPDMYDPHDWARRAKAAGMKYAILTAKHHEGFCMWDTQYTDYKCTNTPAGRDLVREFIEAFREEGLRVGLYYSLIDWHHPEFPIDMAHPLVGDPRAKEMNLTRDMKKYAQYMRDQVKELLTNYGKIDILWFDFSYSGKPGSDNPYEMGKGKDDWEAEKLIALARSINPDIIIDNRTEIEQDIWTPEQYQPREWVKDSNGSLVTWETCQTFSGSWGYYRDEMTWKSPEMLIRMLINTVSFGGNLLMNVGPTSRGFFDYRAKAALDTYAEWMLYNNRSIYGCTMAEPDLLALCPNGCRFTQSEDGSRLYIHLMEYPFRFLEIPGLGGRVEYAQFLHDGSEVVCTENVANAVDGRPIGENHLVFNLPVVKPPVTVPVIEVFLK